jgi:protein-S-isoprenylcysteine O-methyltransferase Ste14
MKPTAYILFVVGVVLALSAALLYMSSSSYSADSNGVHADPGRSPTLMFALLAAAAGIAALVWAMLRFGGNGYTETNSPLRR